PNEDLEERYARQILLSRLGLSGQERLRAATALVVGCGALGTHQADLLVRAGVGVLRIADRDVVERVNLHRQVLFDEDDLAAGLPKAEAAARKLRRINPGVVVDARVMDVRAFNVEALVEGADVVLDATDNFESRYLLNDVCVKLGIPFIYGGVIETQGMTLAILPGQTPCLRCLFPEPPPPGALPTCDTVGILPTLPAVIAARQVTEALKCLVDRASVCPDLVQLDLWENSFRSLKVAREPGCPCCSQGRYDFLSVDGAAWVTTLCGRMAVQITPAKESRLDLSRLASALGAAGQVTDNGLLLRFRPSESPGKELLIFPDGRVVVKGTTDEALARGLYARFLGG
ncbi:MAG: ThiF family adenylyltransferase, partial [Polyangia bacterium]|nr:ThiF family adenylyltransferase [Polyangia bacterium]